MKSLIATPIDPHMTENRVRKFFDHVRREGDCWLWRGATNKHGYGRVYNGRALLAHRLAYALVVGPIPAGINVLHRCDTPACINPDHLFLGSQTDNMLDMARKGRNAKGERIPQAKLTPDAVRSIRADNRRHAAIAHDFGVSASLVSFVKSGKIWRHV